MREEIDWVKKEIEDVKMDEHICSIRGSASKGVSVPPITGLLLQRPIRFT